MLDSEYHKNKIREWAKEHGGKTPSEKVFYKYAETNINNLKKCGYPNYGQFVRDVRLTPNKFDNTKYTPDQLCKFFIKVIRDKHGKWPTRGDLDVRRYKDNKFPASATFYDSLGKVKTGGLPRRILSFIKDKKTYIDIANTCNGVLRQYDEGKEISKGDQLVHGFVYLYKSTLKNVVVYKIGKTTNWEQRVRSLHQSSNIEVEEYRIETDDINGVEQYWLKRFSDKRLYPNKPKNEWFTLDSSDVKAFKRWKIF